MATNISIPGGHGSTLVFNVSGSSLINEIQAFASILQNAAAPGGSGIVFNNLSAPTTSSATHGLSVRPQAATQPTVNTIYSGGPSNVYGIPGANEYTIVAVGDATTVNGSAGGGDTVIGGATFTYEAGGNNNDVLFTTGTNAYEGNGTTGDSITAGSGFDTITAGSGSATVFGGAGSSVINLNDASTSGAFAGEVYLGSGGHSTVNAGGYSDVVVAASAGQTIVGADSLTSADNLVVAVDASSVAGSGNDLIQAGGANTFVFDSVGGNTIFGSTGAMPGTLVFVGETSASTVADSIVGGKGTTVIFGAAGDSVTFSNDTTGAVITAIAGGGNETLNGANAGGGFNFFGGTDTTAAATVIGGSGYNSFQTGTGTEAILGGTGTNNFYLTDGGGAHITIFDFASGNDSVAFTNAADSVSLSTGVVSNGNLTLTLTDNTTVEFIGVTSLSGHII